MKVLAISIPKATIIQPIVWVSRILDYKSWDQTIFFPLSDYLVMFCFTVHWVIIVHPDYAFWNWHGKWFTHKLYSFTKGSVLNWTFRRFKNCWRSFLVDLGCCLYALVTLDRDLAGVGACCGLGYEDGQIAGVANHLETKYLLLFCITIIRISRFIGIKSWLLRSTWFEGVQA